MSNEANPKLYIFCIGGTGARVMKALTFLLATGVEMEASQIIPIIIDPDKANGDVTRTVEVLQKYQEIRAELEFKHNHFFETEIKTLASLEIESHGGYTSITEGFKFKLNEKEDGKFQNFIQFSRLVGPNKALIEALF